MKSNQILPIFIGLLLLLSGCKPEKPESDGAEYPDLGRPLNEVMIQIDAEPDRLNPLLTTNNYATGILSGLFSYLLAIDPVTVELVPQLAESRPEMMAITEGPYQGGMAYTYEIREQARWDDGSPVTADDFIFTMKALFNPKVSASAYRVYLSFIRDITVDEDNPKRFTVLTDQKYIIGEEAISAALPVLPAYHYDPDGLLSELALKDLADEATVSQLAETDERLQQFADQFATARYGREPAGVNGCGPYRLVSWETGQRIVLERKTDWWGDEVGGSAPGLRSYPEKLTYLPISDPNAAVTALKDGRVDAMANIQPKQFMELQDNEYVAEHFNFYNPPSLVNVFVYINTRVPKLADPKVRRALAHAVDADEIINTAFYGFAERTATPVHPSFSYYNKELSTIPYDPETARRLLAEAGWSDTDNNGIVDREIDGVQVELSLNYVYTAGRSVSENVALLMQESAKKAGINIVPVPQEFTVTQEDLKRRNFELVGGAKAIQSTPWEPKQDFHSEGDDRTGFASPETDELIDRIQVTMDRKERAALYLELQREIYDKAPIVYLMVPQSRLAIHKRFDTEVTPIFPGYSAHLLRLKE